MFRRLLALVLFVAVIAAAYFAIYLYRHRFVRSRAGLVQLLPPGDLTTFFFDIATLRSAHMLSLLTGIKPAGEKDYAEFVSETGFDYTRDMDAVAGAFDGEQLFFVVQGRFHWHKLRSFAAQHAGTCQGNSCVIPASTPGRWANFFEIQPDVIGLAVSKDYAAAYVLRPPGRRPPDQPPLNPVWVRLSLKMLKDPAGLPVPLRIFAISMQSANSVTLSLAPAGGRSEAFAIQLDADFVNESTADTARKQLEIQTRMLKLELGREQRQANPADLSGLLTGGVFQVNDKRLTGSWPVRKELLSSLE